MAHESLISSQEMRDHVEHALAVGTFMRRLGWIVLFLATASLIVTVALWLHGDITSSRRSPASSE